MTTTAIASTEQDSAPAWQEVKQGTWVAKRGPETVGLIEEYALFIATDKDGDAVGFFTSFAEAQAAVECPAVVRQRGQYRGRKQSRLRTLRHLIPGTR